MFCPQCGTQNTEIAAFCQRCGYPLQEQTAMKKHEKMKKPKRKRHWIVATLCALVILVVFGSIASIAYVYYTSPIVQMAYGSTKTLAADSFSFTLTLDTDASYEAEMPELVENYLSSLESGSLATQTIADGDLELDLKNQALAIRMTIDSNQSSNLASEEYEVTESSELYFSINQRYYVLAVRGEEDADWVVRSGESRNADTFWENF